MALRWCSIVTKWKLRASGSRRVTMCRTSKISKKNPRQKRRSRRRTSDAKTFLRWFGTGSRNGHRDAGKKGTRCAGATEQTKAACARSRQCDRTVLRLFSPLAKESAVFKARTRRGSLERTCLGNCGLGGKPKLRRTRARGVRGKNGGQSPGD